MNEIKPRILQVSTFDTVGGAEKVAWNLLRSYRERGYEAWLAVGHKLSDDPDVLLIPNEQQRSRWARFWMHKPSVVEAADQAKPRNLFKVIAEPGKTLDYHLGREDFGFPGTWKLLNLTPHAPDIVHTHNLHGGYFDLRVLPSLSKKIPLILTLHDAWLLSGHCAHSFGCERWKIGCGKCPDLGIQPPVVRDATSYNWKRKREIYEKSRLYVSTPSQWLLEKIEDSMLAPAVVESRVIPNGVDLSVFRPGEKQKVRLELDIPSDAVVLLFTANNIRQNMWKDYAMIRTALTLVDEQLRERKAVFIGLGEEAKMEPIGNIDLRFVPYQSEAATVARYYQAADVYIHASKADTFPNTVLEALACGTPVVATRVGGIPEQIKEGQTGYLTPVGDPHAFAGRIIELLSRDDCRRNMGREAAIDARKRFDVKVQVDTYLEWYQTILCSVKQKSAIGKD